ncbi:MAG TPA: amidohydrolase family protein [Clostridia bacterium]|nr:amidohydrolase family protein [Clostridia bacterium]
MASSGVVEQDGMIADIGDAAALKKQYPNTAEIRWDGLVMVPGTVNVHNHSFQSLLRGIAADRPFLEWRDEALYKYSPRLTPEDLYNGALFAFGEMLRYGVTTVCDFFYLHNDGLESDEAIIRAAHDLGIRLVLARTMYDWEGAPKGYVESVDKACEHTKMLFEKYRHSDMVSVVPAPHSLHAASLEMIKAGHALAKELGTAFHIHVAEEPFEVEQIRNQYGKRTVELLDDIGVIDESTVIVHGVWLDGGEIETLAKKGGKLAYCPSSNMFLADGITDIEKMLSLGVKIGLGTDGGCSNNRISVFEEMRMAPLLQKAYKHNALCVNYREAFKMGTEWGGELLGLPVGILKKGYCADFVGIDRYDLSMQPVTERGGQLLPNIVYSMQPGAIRRVVAGGVERAADGHLSSIPERTVIERVKETMSRIER